VERAAAIIIATVGILILTIGAVFWVQSRDVRSPPAVALEDGVARLDAETTSDTNARRVASTSSAPAATTSGSSARSTSTATSGSTTSRSATATSASSTSASSTSAASPGGATGPTTSSTSAPAVTTPVGDTSAPTAEFVVRSLLDQINAGALRFAYRSARLEPGALAPLDRLASVLVQQPGVPVGVFGHTDSDGESDENIDLSARRAAAVIDYLAERGVPRSQLIGVALGEGDPIASNEDAAGQEANRRVEIAALDPLTGAVA
jgi:outer membrane protein OmpA-like peptidoglycan-associated protein